MKEYFPAATDEVDQDYHIIVTIMPSIIILELFPLEDIMGSIFHFISKAEHCLQTQFRLYLSFLGALRWIPFNPNSNYQVEEMEERLIHDLQRRVSKAEAVNGADELVISLLKDVYFVKMKAGEVSPSETLEWLQEEIH